PAQRYAAIWVKSSGNDDRALYVGATAAEQAAAIATLKEQSRSPRSLHEMVGPDGRPSYCGVWGRGSDREAAVKSEIVTQEWESDFERDQSAKNAKLLVDLSVSGASTERSVRGRAEANLAIAEETLKTLPDDVDAKFLRSMANFRLNEYERALDESRTLL